MISISYNTNGQSICSTAYHNNRILDIAIVRLNDNSSVEEVIDRATRSSARLYEEHGKSMDIRFRYPSILKENKQEEMINQYFSEDKITEYLRTPFSINGVIASMVEDGLSSYVSYRDISEPWYMYTDASVTKSREPSISCCLLSDEGKILSLFATEIPMDNVAVSESLAGILGFRVLDQLSHNPKVEWFCDNQNVIDYYDGKKNRSKLNGHWISDIMDKEDLSHINTNSISGSDNNLADSMAKELRHKEMKETLLYSSPALDNEMDHEVLVNSRKNIIDILN